MSDANKPLYRSRKNEQGKIVFDGSTARGGKRAPTTAQTVKSSLSKKGSKLPDPSLSKVPITSTAIQPMSGDDLDILQDREDYLNIFADMGRSYSEDLETDAELKGLFIARVNAYAQSEAGRAELAADLELLIENNLNVERDFRALVIARALDSHNLLLKEKIMIDSMNYEQMLSKWRFAPADDPLFSKENPNSEYFQSRMRRLRDANPSEAFWSRIGIFGEPWIVVRPDEP